MPCNLTSIMNAREGQDKAARFLHGEACYARAYLKDFTIGSYIVHSIHAQV